MSSNRLVLGVLVLMLIVATGIATTSITSRNRVLRQEDDHAGEENHADEDDHSEKKCNFCCTTACVRNWKIGFAAIIFLEGIIFAYANYLIKRVAGSHSGTVFHITNAVSGGVFFATGILHLLPEAVELSAGGEHGHGEEEGEEEDIKFPLGYCMVLVGYYAFLFLERVLLPKVGLGGHLHSVDEEGESMEKGEMLEKEECVVTGIEQSHHYRSHDHHDHKDHHDNKSEAMDITSTSTSATVDEAGDRPEETKKSKLRKTLLTKTMLRCLFIILGISIHSLVESLVLGIADTFTSALNVFLATILHRWATAAALGVKLKKENVNFLQFSLLVLLFSLVAPIGIFLGFPLSDLSSAKAQGIAIGVSAGVFIYIGAFDIMSEEFLENRIRPLFTFLAALSGALVITVITVITTTVLQIHG